MPETVLEVAGLRVGFTHQEAVRGVSLTVGRGETHCLVGESGCGKSMTALAIMGLLPRAARRAADRLHFEQTDLGSLSDRRMGRLRGDRIGMIFQEPMTSLNPAFTIGSQMTEIYRRHRGGSRAAAAERAAAGLARVGISGPQRQLGQFPHQLSGGLRQRVMIASALLCDPALLIADEPTTALDVTVQADILRLLQRLQHELGVALLLITHDLGVVARIADRVSVMYAGEIVEHAPVAALFARPSHPYTRGLLASVPVPGKTRRDEPLGSIPGTVPRLAPGFIGCPFRDRCSHALSACAADIPWRDAGPGPSLSVHPDMIIDIRDVARRFGPVQAVDGVDLTVAEGSVMGIVGESGCGKSTLARLVLGLLALDRGSIRVAGQRLDTLDRRARARLIQPIFQDPYASLNPRQRIRDIVALPLRAQGERDRADRVLAILGRVGLAPDMADRYPHQLSGGQRQRVAIARALILHPRIIVCDEPTSALDVSIQAQILNLLAELRRDFGLTLLFISHNLAVVEHIATEVAVMYLGRIVERAPVDDIFANPLHPYTKALLASVLTPEPGLGIPNSGLGDAYPDPANIPPGCRFHPRCPIAVDRCRTETPAGRETGQRFAECLLAAD